MARLDGKTALISGGASGIGKAIAQLFLEEGARVVITDINADALKVAVDELATFGPVSGVSGDVRRMQDAGEMVSTAVDRHGSLDVLVCNAGITSVMPIEMLEEEEWDRVLATNVKGMFTLVKHAVPHMKAQGHGSIVTLGSEMGIVAVPESPAYNASKGAVIMFTKDLANYLAPSNILVNAVCPGPTRTPLWEGPGQLGDQLGQLMGMPGPEAIRVFAKQNIPLGHLGDPEDIANMVAFLASDKAKFITGQAINVDGGMVKAYI